ncbi:pentapeptide repeat-containing protein [Moorena sp. SIO4G3]|uniref:pentapeptide repeat-containing protein n=1 Tax=Moorena sp. SIO4G3 TaxID=2607821 RepID=UPI001428E543|nr:pentapeptide repeat-containing protein [Moorena sp. SIO4G3]NEO81282.1 pentapeptide repeat-containing protein [Moorena sp. SIO4G3]
MTNLPEPLPPNQPEHSNNGSAKNSANGHSPPSPPETQEEQHLSTLPLSNLPNKATIGSVTPANRSLSLIILTAIAIMIFGVVIDNFWIGISGATVALLVSLPVIVPVVKQWLTDLLPPPQRIKVIASIGVVAAISGLLKFLGVYQNISHWLVQIKWDEFGSWAEWVGALGQILIAVLAVFIAWRQYVISKDLTIQQNMITQQQTIDAYFQGVSDLALDDQGLLEDWPQERAFCEGRTAAILSSVDAHGKAKVLRFLSQARLLTPLRRDNHLGRPMLDGYGGYQEDRIDGIRVIDLNVMLAGSDLSGTDLRWTELGEANMVRANLSFCDLVQANLSRTVLYEANLTGADLKGVCLFYGSVETASPRSRTHPPDYPTGAYTGAVVENVNFTSVQRMDEKQHYYCCAWCGEKSRKTIPGGCQGIPNKLGR